MEQSNFTEEKMPIVNARLTQGYIRYVANRNETFLRKCDLIKLQIVDIGETSEKNDNGFMKTPVILTDGIYYIHATCVSHETRSLNYHQYLGKYQVIQIDGTEINWTSNDGTLVFWWCRTIEQPGKFLGRNIMEHMKHSKNQTLKQGTIRSNLVPP